MLTPAERQALDAVARYGSIKAAAYALRKSPYTLDAQIRSARTKLGAVSTIQAYAMSRDVA